MPENRMMREKPPWWVWAGIIGGTVAVGLFRFGLFGTLIQRESGELARLTVPAGSTMEAAWESRMGQPLHTQVFTPEAIRQQRAASAQAWLLVPAPMVEHRFFPELAQEIPGFVVFFPVADVVGEEAGIGVVDVRVARTFVESAALVDRPFWVAPVPARAGEVNPWVSYAVAESPVAMTPASYRRLLELLEESRPEQLKGALVLPKEDAPEE